MTDKKQNILEVIGPHSFVDPKTIAMYEKGLHAGPLDLQPFQIHLDQENSRWNDCLANLFVARFVQEYPDMEGRDDIKNYFTGRIRTLKNTCARMVPMPGESLAECQARVTQEVTKTHETNRQRSRVHTVSRPFCHLFYHSKFPSLVAGTEPFPG